MNYTEFENKVKSMTAHDIIMSMVYGLRSPRTKIDMSTFGEIKEGTCYGCAATNLILNIMDINEDKVVYHILARESMAHGDDFLGQFENAIDLLRLGQVHYYNSYAMSYGFAPITPMPDFRLPPLEDDYTEGQLQAYVKLAEYQLTVKS